MKKLFYNDEDINDIVEAEEHEFFKNDLEKGRGPDKQKRKSRGSNTTADKMAEINAHFGDNMEQSVKNYLSQEHKIGPWAHSVRVNDVHGRVLRERAKKQS